VGDSFETLRDQGEDLREELRIAVYQRDQALAEAHLLRRKIEAAPTVTKPASNVRATAPTEVRVGTASYSSRPFTPAPKK
jgi:hypothetical protein